MVPCSHPVTKRILPAQQVWEHWPVLLRERVSSGFAFSVCHKLSAHCHKLQAHHFHASSRSLTSSAHKSGFLLLWMLTFCTASGWLICWPWVDFPLSQALFLLLHSCCSFRWGDLRGWETDIITSSRNLLRSFLIGCAELYLMESGTQLKK